MGEVGEQDGKNGAGKDESGMIGNFDEVESDAETSSSSSSTASDKGGEEATPGRSPDDEGEKNSDDDDVDMEDHADEDAGDDAGITTEAPEAAPVITVRNPADPTPAERAEHEVTHCPYRPWCPVCVEAMGREDPPL